MHSGGSYLWPLMEKDPSLDEKLAFFAPLVTESKRKLIDEVLESRTRHLSVGLEDIYQPQNASAVLRTCDCFGVQDVHVIEKRNEYTLNPDVALGSQKWTDLHRYRNEEDATVACIEAVRSKGYRIVATTPVEPDHDPESFPLEEPACLFFGTELEGLSETVLEAADERLVIPMYGFTQSFNISVSAAILLYRLTERLRGSNISWQLSETEKKELRLKWYRKVRSKVNPPWEGRG